LQAELPLFYNPEYNVYTDIMQPNNSECGNNTETKHSPHVGYISLLPLIYNMLDDTDPALNNTFVWCSPKNGEEEEG